MKHSFKNDYGEGCHQCVLEQLAKTNLIQADGYGQDQFTKDAKAKIQQAIDNENADIYFVSGGTQANLVMLASALKSFQSILAPKSSHAYSHETGAIEATGHQINIIEAVAGKITPDQVKEELKRYQMPPITVQPKIVHISNTTEVGTVYTKSELTELSSFCKRNNLYLTCDGARLANALASKACDYSLQEFSNLVDMFWIGGTKNGLLFGEAIVINNDTLKPNFMFHLRQRGALMAKGRAIAIQFQAIFNNNLYMDLASHANQMAQKIADKMKTNDHKFLADPVSNQLFPILPNTLVDSLEKNYGFHRWGPVDKDHSAIRIITSWATPEQVVNEFIKEF